MSGVVVYLLLTGVADVVDQRAAERGSATVTEGGR